MTSFADWLALREQADAAARSVQLADTAARTVLADSAGRSTRPADAGADSSQPADSGARSTQPADPAARSAQPADSAARSGQLADRAGRRAPVLVHDLGSGTGSMVRWLAPRLRTPQHWVLHDRDADLLALAARSAPPGVTVETRVGDLTRLTAADLADASLVTCSALLDMLTAAEIERLVAACAARPTLLTLTVVGAVKLDPPHPLDAAVAAAFDAHQRRTVGGRTLAGPDAADVAMAAFRDRGIVVEARETPWRLGPGPLARAWFDGWLGAALEQEPDLSGQLSRYVPGRMEQLRTGRLTVSVGHRDLYAPGDT